MKEIIEKEISLSKEVFHSLPFNNQKNKNKFLGEITNEITHYEDMLQQIYQELENRQKVYLNLKENDYKEYTAVLEQLTKALSYTNNFSTAYEKLKLDKQIYHLVHYQQNNLSKNNQVLKKIIDIFEKAGIPLRLQDFSYTKYVNQYMESFFTYQYCLESGDLEKTFEEIYWKDPYIILELELNIRMLYLKHEKKFEKYVQQVTKQLLSQFEKGESNLIEDYAYLRKKLEQVKIEDKNNVLYHFVHGDYRVEDYYDNKMEGMIQKYFGQNNHNMDEIYQTSLKLLNTLTEYQNYIKYESMIDKIKKLYQETFDKNVIKKQLKTIQTLEKKLFKLNKKSTHSFSKTKVDKLEPEIHKTIQEIHEQYKVIDQSIIQFVLKNHLQDHSTLFKALLLVQQYYCFIADLCKEKNEQISDEEIMQVYHDFTLFVLDPNNTMINNITIAEQCDIKEMIIANYRLLGMQLSSDLLNGSNLEECISELNKIMIYYQMKKMNINIQDLENMNKINKIMERK